MVAPPRGERGLKRGFGRGLFCRKRRSPSWGAWIETTCAYVRRYRLGKVAPPRGERGLKQLRNPSHHNLAMSLPLVGSVD